MINPAGLGLAEMEICVCWDTRHPISMAPFEPKSTLGGCTKVDLGHIGGHRF